MKAVKQSNKFQVAAEYITDYAGVKGAVIIDSEGLVIFGSPEKDFDCELWAARGLELASILDKNLGPLAKPGCEYLSIKTGTDWITVAKSSSFYLIVSAERKADDLLSVRISRALDMIASHLNDKYPALKLASEPASKSEKKMEAANV